MEISSLNGTINFYSLLAIIFAFNVLAGCKSTDTKSKGWNIEMGDCQSRVHPTKTNPTADYKACSFNFSKQSMKATDAAPAPQPTSST